MFKGKKDEVAWRGIDAIKNKKKARTNVYSFILTSDHHCTPDARPLHLWTFIWMQEISLSLHVFPISVNLQRSITSIIFDIIKLHYSYIKRSIHNKQPLFIHTSLFKPLDNRHFGSTAEQFNEYLDRISYKIRSLIQFLIHSIFQPCSLFLSRR